MVRVAGCEALEQCGAGEVAAVPPPRNLGFREHIPHYHEHYTAVRLAVHPVSVLMLVAK